MDHSPHIVPRTREISTGSDSEGSALASPLYLLVSTFLLQLLVSRMVRYNLDNNRRLVPAGHRYHLFPPEAQRRTECQLCSLLMKAAILYYTAPLLRLYLATMLSGRLAEWTPANTRTLDSLLAVLASMYLFDIAHHHAALPYFVHHFVSLAVALATRAHGCTAMIAFFTPFFVPGIVLGDTCGELVWLLYRLAPLQTQYAVVIRRCSFVHLAARVCQWACIAVYIVHLGPQMLAGLGAEHTGERTGAGVGVALLLVLLAGALLFWAYCECFYVSLCFWLGREFDGRVGRGDSVKPLVNQLTIGKDCGVMWRWSCFFLFFVFFFGMSVGGKE